MMRENILPAIAVVVAVVVLLFALDIGPGDIMTFLATFP